LGSTKKQQIKNRHIRNVDLHIPPNEIVWRRLPLTVNPTTSHTVLVSRSYGNRI
jgi:hypothetical protein